MNCRRYSDGSYRVTLLSEDETSPVVTFPSAWEMQAFVSAWYQPEYRPL